MMCYSDKDDELWNEDPYEYIRMKFGQSHTSYILIVLGSCIYMYIIMKGVYTYMYYMQACELHVTLVVGAQLQFKHIQSSFLVFNMSICKIHYRALL